MQHAKAVYLEQAESQSISAAKYLWKRISGLNSLEVTKSDLCRATQNYKRGAFNLDDSLKELERRGYIKLKTIRKEGNDKPTTIILKADGDLQSPSVSYSTDESSKSEKDKPDKTAIESNFEALWELYPKKKGKGSISDKQKAVLYKIGFDELSRCIERYEYEIELEDTDTQFISYGSTFFNSGYVDYLDENYEEPVRKTSTRPRDFYKIDSS